MVYITANYLLCHYDIRTILQQLEIATAPNVDSMLPVALAERSSLHDLTTDGGNQRIFYY